MKNNILITGATGLIGKQLTQELLNLGYHVSILSRTLKNIEGVKVYLWDESKNIIDYDAFREIDTIIHLAGENLGRKKWTEKRKVELIHSRTRTTQLLYKAIIETNTPIKTFISASAVGYYGDQGDQVLTEDFPAGGGFVAKCCQLWEQEVDKGLALNIRIVKLRIGFLLSKHGGALPSLEKPIKLFAGAPLGSGKQWVPWIHSNDLIAILIFALTNEHLHSAYNACAPSPVTNKMLTKEIAKQLHRPVWPIHVPENALKLLLGEMSVLLLMSSNTSSQKLLNAGFEFKYTNLNDALKNIYS
jgi:uncharacterized protein (TIGR01777 family)